VAQHLPLQTHLVLLLVAGVEVWSRGMRFQLLAKGMDVPLKPSSAYLTPFVGDAAGAATPSRIGADVGKVWCLLRDGMGLGGAAAVLFGDLILEAVVLVLGGLAILVLAPWAWVAVVAALGYAGLTLLIAVAGIRAAQLPRGKTPPRFWRKARLAARRWRELRVVGRGFLRRSRLLRTVSWKLWIGLLAVSVVHFVGRLAILPLIMGDLATPETLPALIAWPFGLIWVAGFLPPPGGGGGVELGFLATLSSAIPSDAMAGSLLWWRFYTFYLSGLVGAVLGLMVFGKRILVRRR
jgi:uncharacterized membrane protein YbhN (UPF0104 family)